MKDDESFERSVPMSLMTLMKNNDLVRGHKTRYHSLKHDGIVCRIPEELSILRIPKSERGKGVFVTNEEVRHAVSTYEETKKPVSLIQLPIEDGKDTMYLHLYLMYSDEMLSTFTIYVAPYGSEHFQSVEQQQESRDSETFHIPTLHFKEGKRTQTELIEYAKILLMFNTEFNLAKNTLQNRYRKTHPRLDLSSACEAARIQLIRQYHLYR